VTCHLRTRPAPTLEPTPARSRSGSKASSRGELYEYYKRMGMLEVFFSLFPDREPAKKNPALETRGAAMGDTPKKKPTHTAYAVRNFEKDGKPDASWSRIGVARRTRQLGLRPVPSQTY